MTRESRTYDDRKPWQAPAGYGFEVEAPIAGFYKVRIGGGTVRRAVQLTYGPPSDPITGEELDRSWRWMAHLDDGSLAEFEDIWPRCAKMPIDEAEWRSCRARHAWAQQHAPDSAYARAGRKYDPLSTSEPLPF